MSDLIFTVNAVLPIIAMVLIGYVAKRAGLINRELAKGMNKLCFRLFLPVMLFLNVYKIESISDIDLTYVIYVMIAVVLIFFIGVIAALVFTKDPRRRGVITQAAFRSNYALIGIPLAESVFGTEGGIVATVLSVFAIPLYNILAVVSLTVFADGEKAKFNFKKVLVGIVKNPLIQSIALGGVVLLVRMAFESAGISFRLSNIGWLYSGVLTKLAAVATPMALVSLGADFEFTKTAKMKKEITVGTALRCIIAPLLGLGAALLIGDFSGAHFAAFIAVFASPIAVSSVPMTESMGSDHNLAGQLVIWTTISSAFTLFLFIYILRVVGIF